MIITSLIPVAIGSAVFGAAATAWLLHGSKSEDHRAAVAEATRWERACEELHGHIKSLEPFADIGRRRQDAKEAHNARNRAKRAPVAEGAVIIIGAQGCGKTRNAEALKAGFRCSNIIDDWDGLKPLAPGDLALTNAHPYLVQDGTRVVTFEVAMGWLNIAEAMAA